MPAPSAWACHTPTRPRSWARGAEGAQGAHSAHPLIGEPLLSGPQRAGRDRGSKGSRDRGWRRASVYMQDRRQRRSDEATERQRLGGDWRRLAEFDHEDTKTRRERLDWESAMSQSENPGLIGVVGGWLRLAGSASICAIRIGRAVRRSVGSEPAPIHRDAQRPKQSTKRKRGFSVRCVVWPSVARPRLLRDGHHARAFGLRMLHAAARDLAARSDSA